MEILSHLINNAIDHGIEENRNEIGKPETGTITIKSEMTDSSVVFTIADDGRGINIENLKFSVMKSLDLSDEDISNKSNQEIMDLIFNPKFSTKEDDSLVSGRGVGLAAAANIVEELGGESITVSNGSEGGACFKFTIPYS